MPTFKTETLRFVSNVQLVKRLWGSATKRNRLRDLKYLGFIEIYRFLKIYNYKDLSRFLESYERFIEIFRFLDIYNEIFDDYSYDLFISHDVT